MSDSILNYKNPFISGTYLQYYLYSILAYNQGFMYFLSVNCSADNINARA